MLTNLRISYGSLLLLLHFQSLELKLKRTGKAEQENQGQI